MGHAGAVISGGNDTAAAKMEAMRAAGIRGWRAKPSGAGVDDGARAGR